MCGVIRECGTEAANRHWLAGITSVRWSAIPLAAELLETEIEKHPGIRPRIRAIQQNQMQFVTVAGGRRRKSMFGTKRPARLGWPHARIHSQELIVILQRLATGSRLERDAARLANFAQFRHHYRRLKYP